MAGQETIGFPYMEEVEKVIPRGREAYIEAAREMSAKNVILGYTSTSEWGVMNAIHTLATAHEEQELVPPLPQALGDMLIGMSRAIKAHGERRSNEGTIASRDDMEVELLRSQPGYIRVAEKVVLAALDHGRVYQP